MAIVKGIIVNDGGAPARIINFTAGEAISAGEALKCHTDGKAMLATDNDAPVAGFALTDAASGAQCSMVTGSGVVLYAICANVGTGVNLMVAEGTAGQLETYVAADDEQNNLVAVTLENNDGAGLTKVLVF